jgi:hypothetical protein
MSTVPDVDVARLAFMVRAALLVVTLVVAGCALPVPSERPITVTMGPAERVRKICTEAIGRPATGCVIREGDRFVVFCPYNDARCLGQESELGSNRPIAETNGSASP